MNPAASAQPQPEDAQPEDAQPEDFRPADVSSGPALPEEDEEYEPLWQGFGKQIG